MNRKRISNKEKEQWSELVTYVRTKVLGYDECMNLPKNMVLRLKGLSRGKYIDNRNVPDKANYSYDVIRYTFMTCSMKIQDALKNNTFKNEMHKFNYIMKIVENNIDDVNERVNSMKNKNSEAE